MQHKPMRDVIPVKDRDIRELSIIVQPQKTTEEPERD